MLDAPYIREAELFGIPDLDPVECPCCGKTCKTIYKAGPDVIGCNHCIDAIDAYDWAAEGRE